jgi:Domain of unknown function (DUF397)
MIIVGSPHDEFSWRKSKYSTGNGECVEVSPGQSAVHVRDSKRPSGPMLSYPAAVWQSFLTGAKLGDFDAVSLL